MNDGLNPQALTPDYSGVAEMDLEETKRMIEDGARRFWKRRGGDPERSMTFKERTRAEIAENRAEAKKRKQA